MKPISSPNWLSRLVIACISGTLIWYCPALSAPANLPASTSNSSHSVGKPAGGNKTTSTVRTGQPSGGFQISHPPTLTPPKPNTFSGFNINVVGGKAPISAPSTASTPSPVIQPRTGFTLPSAVKVAQPDQAASIHTLAPQNTNVQPRTVFSGATVKVLSDSAQPVKVAQPDQAAPVHTEVMSNVGAASIHVVQPQAPSEPKQVQTGTNQGQQSAPTIEKALPEVGQGVSTTTSQGVSTTASSDHNSPIQQNTTQQNSQPVQQQTRVDDQRSALRRLRTWPDQSIQRSGLKVRLEFSVVSDNTLGYKFRIIGPAPELDTVPTYYSAFHAALLNSAGAALATISIPTEDLVKTMGSVGGLATLQNTGNLTMTESTYASVARWQLSSSRR